MMTAQNARGLTDQQCQAIVRVVKQQVRLAISPIAAGRLGFYLEDLEVEISRRRNRRGMDPNRAGQSGVYHGQGRDVGRVVVNAQVCYTEERFTKTLLHEVAHAVTAWLWGEAADCHGPKWQEVMRRLGQEPTRCHSYRDRL